MEKCPEMEDQAEAAINKYRRALILFSKCHKYFDTPSLSTLRQYTLYPQIGDIDDYYRSTFPNRSVTPKLHKLEDHVAPFLRRWRVGLGIFVLSRYTAGSCGRGAILANKPTESLTTATRCQKA